MREVNNAPKNIDVIDPNPHTPRVHRENFSRWINDNLHSLESRTWLVINMSEVSLATRRDVARIGSTDTGFPVTLIGGFGSQATLPTNGAMSYETKGISPSLRSGVIFAENAKRWAEDDAQWVVSITNRLQEAQGVLTQTQTNITNSITRRTTLNNEIEQQFSAMNKWVMSLYNQFPWWVDGLVNQLSEWITSGSISYNATTNRYESRSPTYASVVQTLTRVSDYIDQETNKVNSIYLEISRLENQLRTLRSSEYYQQDSVQFLTRYLEIQRQNLAMSEETFLRATRDRFTRSFGWDTRRRQYAELYQHLDGTRYSPTELDTLYKNVANQYWSLLYDLYQKKIPSDPTSIERELIARWSTLTSRHEQILFINLMGEELRSRTYNRNVLSWQQRWRNTNLWDQISNLATATFEETYMPLSVCTGIHSAMSKVAKLWGIDAWMVTVWSKSSGHVISLFRIGDKYIGSDYGNTSIWVNTEQLLDTYALANKRLVFVNYLTDENGKPLGKIYTPLNMGFEKILFPWRTMEDYLRNPGLLPEWVEVEMTNLRKWVRLTKNSDAGWYTRLGIKEEDLFWLKIQSAAVSLWRQFSGDNYDAFIEWSLSQARVRFDENYESNDYGWRIRWAVVGKWWDIAGIHIKPYIWWEIRGQLWGLPITKPSNWQAADVEISVGAVWQTNIWDSSTIRGKVWMDYNIMPDNIQSVLGKVGGFSSTSGNISLHQNWDGFSTDVWASISKNPISHRYWLNGWIQTGTWWWQVWVDLQRWINTLGPSNSQNIEVRVVRKIGNMTLEAWISDHKIGWLPRSRRANIGAKFNF